jgi:chemotaxis protein MotB
VSDAETGLAGAESRIVILQDQLEQESASRRAALAELEGQQRTIVDLRSQSERDRLQVAQLTQARDEAEAAAAEARALAASRETVIVDLRSQAEREAALAAALRQEAAERERELAESQRAAQTARVMADSARQRIEVISGRLEQSEEERQAALARLAAAQDDLIIIQDQQQRTLESLEAIQGELVSAVSRAEEAEAKAEEGEEARQLVIDLRRRQDASSRRITSLSGSLSTAQSARNKALQDIELLTAQLSALRRQLGALQTALDASEERDVEQNAQIADLGRRLNVALAQKVKELSRYRSEFFGKLRQILSNRSDIRIVGDRFVFQSEVLFPSASASINDAGRAELDKLADAIIQLEQEIPAELNWVLRVDGHTDRRAISSFAFESNWELSAARAISVVQYLIGRGVAPNRLVAAGFGEFQPLDREETDEAFSRNRRIELKLTER